MTGMGDLGEALIVDWLRARDGVIGQVEKLTEKQLAWTPGPGARTGIEIARHIADASSNLTQLAVTGSRPQSTPTPDGPGSREEVLKRLKAGRTEIEERIRSVPDDKMVEKMKGLMGNDTTRFNFLGFCFAHEMYHWGQLGLFARAGGEIPHLTQNIEAMRKKAAAAAG